MHRLRWISLFLAVTTLLFMTAQPARAHPHVWVDYGIEARFDAAGLVGFQHRWTFDEMFSSQIMEMFDADGDGVFSAEEIEEVRQGAFEYLSEYDYFIQIKVNGSPFHVASVTDFRASIQGHQVVYDFFVPCPIPAGAEPKTVHLLVADMEYFVDLGLKKDGLSISGQEHVTVRSAFHSSEAFSFWGGAWEPRHLTIEFQKSS
ncbi:DUF1007 family protein [Desulfonatronum thiodismutans]|uniref:DUF1007 family protein n=1 Tax=Desulfonatronum thiodismutans TaxID=159290 RepID=UPI0004ABD6F8|nr:DUF1007 family protein [Desulfonatronum thiodismutans]